MLSVEQIEIINNLTESETEKKIDFIVTSYEGKNKEEILEALRGRLKTLRSVATAYNQFQESQSELVSLKD
jgi:tRNA U34 5-carboxymethylaminomethyl modifying GTPase MnmE/TrmE